MGVVHRSRARLLRAQIPPNPVVGAHTVGLDIGCVYGNALTACDCTTDRLMRVGPDRTYHERATHKWVHPEEAVPAGSLARGAIEIIAD